jgi:AraC-like DNA-binding protein
VDRAALLREAGLHEESLDPDSWLPIERHLRLGQAISAALPGQNLGLQTGAPIFSDPRGALGYSLRQSQSHQRALKNFSSYIATVHRAIRIVLLSEGRGTSVLLEMAPEMEAVGHCAEALFAAWVAMSRHLTNSAWRPLEVMFVHQPFAETSEHRALFGCPVSFGCRQNRLLLSESDASLEIAAVTHEFESTLGHAVEYAGALLRADSAAARSLGELWKRLRTAPLDVRDGTEDSSSAGVTARVALGRALLERSGVFVHEVAYVLGFQGMPAFEEAFRKHFGLAPVELRSAS